MYSSDIACFTVNYNLVLPVYRSCCKGKAKEDEAPCESEDLVSIYECPAMVLNQFLRLVVWIFLYIKLRAWWSDGIAYDLEWFR